MAQIVQRSGLYKKNKELDSFFFLEVLNNLNLARGNRD